MQHANWDRRQHPRAKLFGTASVLVDGRRAGAYQLQNLSAGGALLEGALPEAAALWRASDCLQLLLELPHQRRPLVLEARVIRTHPRGFIAVAFEGLAPDLEDLIQELVLAHLEHPANQSDPGRGDYRDEPDLVYRDSYWG